MIRWRFLLTRLVLLIAVMALLRWGLGPVIQHATQRVLQRSTAAKVEIGRTRVGFFPPRVRYQRIAVADPRRDEQPRTTLTAESLELILDGEALLDRRFVAREGSMTGIKIDVAGEPTSGAAVTDRPTAATGPSGLSRLLQATTDRSSEQTAAMAAELETVRRGDQIRRRWSQEYTDLTTRARTLEQQIRAVRDRTRGINNPLRDLPQLERTLAEARDARNELLHVHQELVELPQQLQTDLAMLDEAKRNDLAKLDQFVPGAEEDAPDFGTEMLTARVRTQINEAQALLESGRELAGFTMIAPQLQRSRGTDYDLRRVPRPSLLVRRCEVHGVLHSSGDVFTVSGMLENATSTPGLLDQPTRARLSLSGPEQVRVEYVRDRRPGADIDSLTVHWPAVAAEPLQLGNDREATLQVAGGQRELWVQLHTDGRQVDGRLVSKRTGVAVDLKVDARYVDTPTVRSLEASLSAVDRIEIDASFTGEWPDIGIALQSNLGQIMRRATRDAIDEHVRQTRRAMAAQIETIHAEQTTKLRQWAAEQQAEAVSLIASADQLIEEMSTKVRNEVSEADRYIGRLRGTIQGGLR